MISYLARHYNAANLLMFGIIALGIMALPNLKRDTFPELKNDQVQVKIIYKGATAEEVEDAVCRRVEEAVEGIAGLEETQCEAREGVALAVITMQETADIERFLDDVKSDIEAISDFPVDVEEAVINEIGRTVFLASLAVSGPENPIDLKAYAEDLKARLQALRTIAEVDLRGFSNRQIRIEIPARYLEQYSLSAVNIADSIRAQSIGIPLGRIEGPAEDLILRFDDQRKTPDAFHDIVIISSVSGAEIRLGDIADITDTFETDESKIEFNGQRAAMLDIFKAKSGDVLNVVEQVKGFIEEERIRAPKSISLTMTRDVGTIVQGRLDLLVSNGLQGLLLVVLILTLFFSLRFSFWVAMGLPVSFLGTLFVMSQLDMSLNQITMVGLLIAIGLLMDDAIVISENIAVRLKKGDKPIPAAINGVTEVLPGILSSFLTTVLIFGSLVFLDGRLGQILGVLPIVLIVTLSVSLIEAFFILPNHLSHSLEHMNNSEPSRFSKAFESGFNRLKEDIYGTILDIAIRWRYVTIGLVIMLLLISFSMLAGGVLKVRGFPDIEGDVIEARILLPQGTPLSRTQKVVDHLIAQLDLINDEFKPQQPDQAELIVNVAAIYSTNNDAYETGPHVATVSADLLSAETRKTTIDEIFTRWRELSSDLPDVIAIKYTESTVGPAGRAIDVRLSGPDLTQLKAASLETLTFLGTYKGVNDLSDDLRPGKREFRLHLKDGASVLGLSARNIADQLRASFQGLILDEFPAGLETFEVDLRIAVNDRNSEQDLEQINLIGPNGVLIPLKSVVEIEEVRGWARINRFDGVRTVSVQGDVDTRLTNTAEITAALKNQFLVDLVDRYPGVSFEIEGESANSGETQKSMGRNMLMGLIGVYILLAVQFRGYLIPILIMAIIPTAMIGVIWGHLLLGLEISMPSLIGGASLAGVVVNNSILMMQFIGQEREIGATADEAASYAGRRRFRAIVLTSLTTVAGLLPLLLERSTQAQILTPLATSLAFGLAVASVLSLFLMPALYCIMDDFKLIGKKHDVANDEL